MAIDSSDPPPPPSDFPAEKKQTNQKKAPKNLTYKTKKIKFRNQYKRIILQYENGPCPLIAICNVLILRNEMNVGRFEVSQEELLNLLGAIVLNRDGTENQQQKISDAFHYLPDLAEGINVNIHFRRICDFEPSPHLAVFDVLNIPLYHGWIVDPKDNETASAIGCNSYNDLTTRLVNLKTQTVNPQSSVDFTPTITPSQPCSKKTRPFADTTPTSAEHRKLGRGDLEEQQALMQALLTSKMEKLGSDTSRDSSGGESVSGYSDAYQMSEDGSIVDSSCTSSPGSGNIFQMTKCDDQVSSKESGGDETVCVDVGEEICSTTSGTKINGALDHDHLSSTELGDEMLCDVDTENSSKTTALHVISSDMISAETKNDNTSENSLTSEAVTFVNPDLAGRSQDDDQFSLTESEHATDCDVGNEINVAEESRSATSVTKSGALESDQLSSTKLGDETVCDVETENSNEVTDVHVTLEKTNLESTKSDSGSEIQFKSEAVTFVNPDLTDGSQDEDVALYEAEKCVSVGSPVYKGESLLGKSSSEGKITNGLKRGEGEVIEKFLASQLTFTGLSCLKQGLKDGELCVFFRNNHFSIMLKYDNVLYTLVTDQGYLNERDVVWEKLYETKGDSVFVTGDFEVFESESGNWDQESAFSNTTSKSDSGNWDQQCAFSNTADYIYNINSSSIEEGIEIDPDLKMAMELQEREFGEDTYFEVSVKKQSLIHLSSSIQEGKAVLRWSKDGKCTIMYINPPQVLLLSV